VIRIDTEMEKNKNLRIAFILSLITIIYNIAEGIISLYFGINDETLSLLGFGTDSFVEVISGIGIAHMVLRMRYSKVNQRDKFERQALRITGFGFYILTAGILVGAVLTLIEGSKPENTWPGIVIAGISILTMYFLMKYKLKIGKVVESDAIIADASCTKSCLYLSIVLLVSSVAYEIFQIGYIDIIGSLGIAWFTFSEGRESFEKAKSNKMTCSCNGDCHN